MTSCRRLLRWCRNLIFTFISFCFLLYCFIYHQYFDHLQQFKNYIIDNNPYYKLEVNEEICSKWYCNFSDRLLGCMDLSKLSVLSKITFNNTTLLPLDIEVAQCVLSKRKSTVSLKTDTFGILLSPKIKLPIKLKNFMKFNSTLCSVVVEKNDCLILRCNRYHFRFVQLMDKKDYWQGQFCQPSVTTVSSVDKVAVKGSTVSSTDKVPLKRNTVSPTVKLTSKTGPVSPPDKISSKRSTLSPTDKVNVKRITYSPANKVPPKRSTVSPTVDKVAAKKSAVSSVNKVPPKTNAVSPTGDRAAVKTSTVSPINKVRPKRSILSLADEVAVKRRPVYPVNKAPPKRSTVLPAVDEAAVKRNTVSPADKVAVKRSTASPINKVPPKRNTVLPTADKAAVKRNTVSPADKAAVKRSTDKVPPKRSTILPPAAKVTVKRNTVSSTDKISPKRSTVSPIGKVALKRNTISPTNNIPTKRTTVSPKVTPSPHQVDYKQNNDVSSADNFAFKKMSMKTLKFYGTSFSYPLDYVMFREHLAHSRLVECNQTLLPRLKKKYPSYYNVKPMLNKTHFEWLVKLRDLLHGSRITPMLAGGTLLGWVRECGIMPQTHDFDLMMLSEEYNEMFEQIFLNHKHFTLAFRFNKKDDSLEYTVRDPTRTKTDVFLLYHESNYSWVGGMGPKRRRLKYFLPQLEEICSADFLGHLFHVPCNFMAFVVADYGSTWDVPAPWRTYTFSMSKSVHIVKELSWKDYYDYFERFKT